MIELLQIKRIISHIVPGASNTCFSIESSNKQPHFMIRVNPSVRVWLGPRAQYPRSQAGPFFWSLVRTIFYRCGSVPGLRLCVCMWIQYNMDTKKGHHYRCTWKTAKLPFLLAPRGKVPKPRAWHCTNTIIFQSRGTSLMSLSVGRLRGLVLVFGTMVFFVCLRLKKKIRKENVVFLILMVAERYREFIFSIETKCPPRACYERERLRRERTSSWKSIGCAMVPKYARPASHRKGNNK